MLTSERLQSMTDGLYYWIYYISKGAKQMKAMQIIDAKTKVILNIKIEL